MRRRSLVRSVERFIITFGFRVFTLQEIALGLYKIEAVELNNKHIKGAYKFLDPLIKEGFIARISLPSILKRVGTDKPVYALTEKAYRIIRYRSPFRIMAKNNEELFVVPYEEAKKEVEELLGNVSERTLKRLFIYRYRIGNNVLILKSDKLENWKKKYPLFPVLMRDEVANLFPKKGYAVGKIMNDIFIEGCNIVHITTVLANIDKNVAEKVLDIQEQRLRLLRSANSADREIEQKALCGAN